MTVYDYADLARGDFGNAAATFAVILTIPGAYLVAAYAIGEKLTCRR
jgi:hypothetical protein